MHGYLRRKVTYNLGRNKGSGKSNEKPLVGESMGGFLNPFTKCETATQVAMIFDRAGGVVTGWDYCLKGEREGWLKRTGMHTGNRGIVYHHFVMEDDIEYE